MNRNFIKVLGTLLVSSMPLVSVISCGANDKVQKEIEKSSQSISNFENAKSISKNEEGQSTKKSKSSIDYISSLIYSKPEKVNVTEKIDVKHLSMKELEDLIVRNIKSYNWKQKGERVSLSHPIKNLIVEWVERKREDKGHAHPTQEVEGTSETIAIISEWVHKVYGSKGDDYLEEDCLPVDSTPEESDFWNEDGSAKDLFSGMRSVQGTWSIQPSYEVRLGDSTSANQRGSIVKNALVYETPLFKYVISPDAYYTKGVSVATHHEWLEQMVAEFEAYVNYGDGAYVRFDRDKMDLVLEDKPVIEFLSSAKSISWGGLDGAEISLLNPEAARSQSSSMRKLQWIHTYSYLLLHEYGHHETMTSATMMGVGQYRRDFVGRLNDKLSQFRNYLISIGEEDLIKYWNGNGNVGGVNFALPSSPWETPFGTLDDAQSIYNIPSYNWKATEWLTRVEGLIESNYNNQFYNGPWQHAMGPSSDIGGMAEWFPDHVTALDEDNIDGVIEAYKEYIYGINDGHFNVEGFLGLAFEEESAIDEVTFTLTFDRNTLATNMNQVITDAFHTAFPEMRSNVIPAGTYELKIPVLLKPIQYRFNTNFRNDEPEEVVNGYAMILDNSESLIERAQAMKTLSTAWSSAHYESSL